MCLKQVAGLIAKAVADEAETHRLANLFGEIARRRGHAPSPQEVDAAVAFIREYIDHVPIALQYAQTAARQLDLAAEVDRLARDLESYWLEADDLIPDHQGLVGIADDAYATLLLFQCISDYCRATFGRPLLSQNLTAANTAVRSVIGDPAASILEQRVGVTLGNAVLGHVLAQVAATGSDMRQIPDPIWRTASLQETATMKLGVLGLV